MPIKEKHDTASSNNICNRHKVHFLFGLCSHSSHLLDSGGETQHSRKTLFGQRSVFLNSFSSPLSAVFPAFHKLQSLYSNVQPLLFLRLRTCSAALVAISNTSRTPSLVLAEHSRQPKALILPAMSLPSSVFTGSCRVGAAFVRKCIKKVNVMVIKNGAAWWFYHFAPRKDLFHICFRSGRELLMMYLTPVLLCNGTSY